MHPSNTLALFSDPLPTFALIGNPNAGKTTLFNALTNLRQKVANYPGVTVDKKYGYTYILGGKQLCILDLPGAYSLNAHSPDELILQSIILESVQQITRITGIIYVLDVMHIERHLYLALQIAHLGWPMIYVLTGVEQAKKRGVFIDQALLEHKLGVSVVTYNPAISATLAAVKATLARPFKSSRLKAFYPQALYIMAKSFKEKYSELQHLSVGGLLDIAQLIATQVATTPQLRLICIVQLCKELDRTYPEWIQMLIQSRHQYIHKTISTQCLRNHPTPAAQLRNTLDSIFLHPILGIACLLLVFLTVFMAIFKFASIPMQGIIWSFEHLNTLFSSILHPGPIKELILEGILPGIGTILLFLPQILLLFFFVQILESTGYLPRAAFVLDKIMGKVGLQGKAFIPLMSAYACAVPAIMGTRIIRSVPERITTILIAPWMSCSARLPIYLLLISLFFPSASTLKKGLLLLTIYAAASMCAFGAAYILRKGLLKGTTVDTFIELPYYRWPNFKDLGMNLWQQAQTFIKRTGTIILGFSIILWFATSYPRSQTLTPSQNLKHSYAGHIGKLIEPIIKPLGYDWKMGIGLISSLAAREVFLSTLSIVYNVEGFCPGTTDCCCGKPKETNSLTAVLKQQKAPNGAPVYTTLTCLSLMAFFMFALQCTSTIAIVYQETQSWKWPMLQFFGMLTFAYGVALVIYQGGRLLGYT